jgi:hypothetical protein
MIYPRFLARFLAWLGGYFWLPCPVCREPFAGFEALHASGCVVVEEADGEHMYGVCPKPDCQAEGERTYHAYMQKRWATGWSSAAEEQSGGKL